MKTNRQEVLFNILKLIVASLVAILLASLLKLEFAYSAGTVAILTIMPTKKETVKTALGRMAAFAIAMGIAYICYALMGFTIRAFAVFLVFFIIICLVFRWNYAVSMCAVLISHFLSFEDMSMHYIMNETLIFALGMGMGFLVNLHLRKDVDYIEQLKDETDLQFKQSLALMSEHILDHDLSDYNGEHLYELRKAIRHARNVADRNFNNQFRSSDIFDIEYIRMREKQNMVLHEMYKIIRHIETKPVTAHRISDFLKEMSEDYSKHNDGKATLERFREMDREIKAMPLPVERKEFEARAMLFSLMRKIEEFITIKIEFSEQFNEESHQKIKKDTKDKIK